MKRTTVTREFEHGELVRETVEVEDLPVPEASPPICTCPCRGWWTYGQYKIDLTPAIGTAPAPGWRDNTAAVVPQAQTFTIPAA